MGEVKRKEGFSPKRCKGAGRLCEKATVARKKAPRSAVLQGAYRRGKTGRPHTGMRKVERKRTAGMVMTEQMVVTATILPA